MSLSFVDDGNYSKISHPLRIPLAAEIHSRPFLQLETPENLTHIALYLGQNEIASSSNQANQHRVLNDLCQHFGVPVPHDGARYFFHDFGKFRLKWECHAEFATYTFVENGCDETGYEQTFKNLPIRHVPEEWLRRICGKVIVAAHVVLVKGDPIESIEFSNIGLVFEGKMLVGSLAGNGGVICTDFLIQPDGFSRFIVSDINLRKFQAGRLVGRLLEIETYRMMALLALPKAEATQPLLSSIEEELTMLILAMERNESTGALSKDDNINISDPILLQRITGIAARMEKLSLNNSYRFSASKAYFSLIQARIQELREERIEGIPTVAEFMGRRLTPAMNTCISVSQRQEALAIRIARSNDLLRTRVGIVQERQNREILESLNLRAAQQLKMQQAVEGLSVIALSYYLVGLIGYAGKALKAANLPIDPDFVTGAMAPIVALLVWRGLDKLHKKLKTAAFSLK